MVCALKAAASALPGLGLVALLLASPARADSYYTCRLADGSILMRDTPCPRGAATMSRRKVPASMMLRTRLSAVRASLHSLQTAVHVHYAEWGEWPTRPEDMGLDSETMSSDEIRAVHFQADGVIVAALSDRFGSNKRIALAPREVLGGARIQWQCFANYPESFVSDGCKSRVIDWLETPAAASPDPSSE